MNTSPAKFIFDVDMGSSSKQTYSKAEKKSALLISEARQKGYQEGLIKGKQDESLRVSQEQLSAIKNIAQQCSKILGNQDNIRKEALGNAIDLSKVVGQKLAFQLINKYPEAELNALIIECLSSIEDAPHLLIRCHPDLVDISQQTAQEYMKISGFSGRLIVMGDEQVKLGDGKIEWADGGLIRSSESINEQIEKSIKEFLKASDIEIKEMNKVVKTGLKEI